MARAVIDQLPHEPILYLGDTARQPYGPKPIGEVREYALECLDHLVDEGVKALVIACNSASAAMLRDARERYDVPVVEVILPAARRAAAATRNRKVGVICTRATASSMAYDDAFAAAPHLDLHIQACPRFVDFVEQGVTGGDELLAAAHEYLDPLVAAGVDTLILGCTHYPLLSAVVSYVMGDGVTLVSSAEETAKDVYRTLVAAGLERPDGLPEPEHRFLTTGDPSVFRDLSRRFLGPEAGGVEALHRRADRNLEAVARWVEATSWADFLARDPATRSNTSVCLPMSDPAFTGARQMAKLLEQEGVAYDLGSYRDAPPGLRIWCGATVETEDVEALLPWLDWAHATVAASS